MGKRIRELFSSLLSILGTIQAIRSISEVVAIIAIVGIATRQWLKGLDTFQLALLLVIAVCIANIVTTYVVDYKRKRNIRYIPELLRQMNRRLRHLIETAKISELDKMQNFFKDLAEIFEFDVLQLEAIANTGDPAQIRDALKVVPSHVIELMQSQPGSLINYLIHLTGLMRHYGIDLRANKDEEYDILEKKLDTLQSRIQDTKTKTNLTTYILWRDSLYDFLLLQHYNAQCPISEEMLPAKAKALLPLTDPLVEITLEDLLSKVTESILGKSKNE